MKPRQILSKICKQEGLPKPSYKDGVCDIGGKKFFAEKDIKDERGYYIFKLPCFTPIRMHP